MVASPVVLGPVVRQNIAYRGASLPQICQETEREIYRKQLEIRITR